MAFRGPLIKHVSGSVRYGPFPIRAGRLAGSFVFLLVAIVLATMAFDEDRLVCTPAASCLVTHRLRSEPPPFAMSALRDATVVIERGSKNIEYGAVLLTVDGIGGVRLGRTAPGDAERVAARIRTAIQAKQPIDAAIRGPVWALLVAVVLLPMWITMAYSALKGLGRFRLEVVRGGAALHVERRVLGLAVGSHDVSLEGITDVRVEPGVLGEMWRHRAEAPTPAARVVLVDRSGRARPITDRAFPGVSTHLRAASELRAVLGLERRRGGVEDELAALRPITTSLGMRIAYSWIGVTVGYMLGVGVYGVVGLALGLLRARDGLDPLALVVGGGGGVVAGVALVFHLTRPRLPR